MKLIDNFIKAKINFIFLKIQVLLKYGHLKSVQLSILANFRIVLAEGSKAMIYE